MTDVQKLYIKCSSLLDLEQEDGFNYYYSSVAFCALDAIFSINARYSTVENVVKRFTDYFELVPFPDRNYSIPDETIQYSVNDILSVVHNWNADTLAQDILMNKQRTSTRNGILKAQAWIGFLKILKTFQIEKYQQVQEVFSDKVRLEQLEKHIKGITGQSSGISFKYFLMLGGITSLFKPDRMVVRFVEEALGRKINLTELEQMLSDVLQELNVQQRKSLTMRHLDLLIWNYQKSNKSSSHTNKNC
jgi:hypothetical protein